MKHIFTFTTGLFLLLLTGCIGDDLSKCYPRGNLSLYFEYPDFPERITGVEVGIFNSDGYSVYRERCSQYALQRYRGIRTTLDAGEYTIVCWGNAFDNSQITGFDAGSHLSDGELSHINRDSEIPLLTHDSLFYGRHTFTIPGSLMLEDTVCFIPAHIGLEITLEGYEDLLNELPQERPMVEVAGLHDSYNHLMNLQHTPVSFFPALDVSEEELTGVGGLYTLRFETVNDIEIVVHQNAVSNNIRQRVPLSPYLISQGIAIDPAKEYLIQVYIPFGDAVTVKVNEWGMIPTNPEL